MIILVFILGEEEVEKMNSNVVTFSGIHRVLLVQRELFIHTIM
jgi:hypothetical protein